MMLKPPRMKTAALATILAFATLPQLVQAAQTYGSFTLDAQYILGASSGTTTNGMSEPNSTQVYANGADYYLDKNDGAGNSIFFHTYGFDSGSGAYFGARASGEGTFFATTSARRSATVTNTSSIAQMLTYTFSVDSGSLGFWGSGTGTADLLLQIAVNGSLFSADRTSMTMAADGTVTCSSNDVGILGSYMNCGAGALINAAATTFNVDLGLIEAGASLTLDYDIVSTVSGNMSGGSVTKERFVCDQYDYYGGDGYGGDMPLGVALFAAVVELPYGCLSGHTETYVETTVNGGSMGRSGDPDNFNFQALNPVATFSDPLAVPEPGSMALLGLGLAGLAASRRRSAKA